MTRSATLRKAIESGELTPDRTILDTTSGNTGIGMAMVPAELGFRIKLTMTTCVSEERHRAASPVAI